LRYLFCAGSSPGGGEDNARYTRGHCLHTLAIIGTVDRGLIRPTGVNYLPETGQATCPETSPPPRNPRLQYCMLYYVWRAAIDGQRDVIRAPCDPFHADLSATAPTNMARDLRKRSRGRPMTFPQAIEPESLKGHRRSGAAGEYRPILEFVR